MPHALGRSNCSINSGGGCGMGSGHPETTATNAENVSQKIAPTQTFGIRSTIQAARMPSPQMSLMVIATLKAKESFFFHAKMPQTSPTANQSSAHCPGGRIRNKSRYDAGVVSVPSLYIQSDQASKQSRVARNPSAAPRRP